MSRTDFGDDAGAGLAFERELIASSATDQMSEEAVRAAWSRFAVTLGRTATLAGTAPTQAAANTVAAGRRTLGWISLGALGGGIVTAALVAVLGWRGAPARMTVSTSSLAPSRTSDGAAAFETASNAATTQPAAPSAVGPEQPAPSVAERAIMGELQVVAPAPWRHGAHSAREVSAPTAAHLETSSSLAAEIALLDDARRTKNAGQFERALALLGRYRREHPHGELQRESDVLKLETLYLSGDRDEAARLAQHFLEAFPDDPHAAHVRTFVR